MMASSADDMMRIDPNFLAYFESIVRHKSFTQAARELGVSKSKLSRAISSLERYIGVRLLDRTSRWVTVTEAGCLLHERCAEVCSAVQAAHQTINFLKSGSISCSASFRTASGLVEAPTLERMEP